MAHQQLLTVRMKSTSSMASLLVLLIGVYFHQAYIVECFVPMSIVSQHLTQTDFLIPPVFRSSSAITSIAASSSSYINYNNNNDDVDDDDDDDDDDETQFRRIEDAKVRLMALCESKNSLLNEIRDAMSVVENSILYDAENDGTNSDMYSWMNGEWELLYTPVDITRSSPFFWAFRQAFPDVSDQIYSITDGIPSPIKEVGPAYQQIDCRYIQNDYSTVSGSFVSRVKVATLGGVATSMMTTRASVIGIHSNYLDNNRRGCELRIKIETTKPEQSTILQKVFGEQYGTMINDMLPSYPSGESLEQVAPGSSEVIVSTTFCDPTLRITKNKNRPIDEFFIWKRKSFNTYDTL